MGQTGRRSIATHILAVKIALTVAHFHGFGVARQGPWITWVNRLYRRCTSIRSRTAIISLRKIFTEAHVGGPPKCRRPAQPPPMPV
jgi:hypothetical protein